MYGHYLRFRGLRTMLASDGIEALQCVESSKPDVVVLDLAMPRLTGWDVIRELRSHPTTRGIPIIALSGQDARESALRAGADLYCTKPCRPDELLREILRLSRGRGVSGR
jgi:twitching motility two-component system response regulator PilH